MPGRHVATAGPASLPVSLPSSLTDSTLTRAGIAAALVTASAAAVAGSTGAFAAVGSPDVSHAATNLTAYSPASANTALPAPQAAVAPVAAPAAASSVALPAVKHTSPAADAAQKATERAEKAAAEKAAEARKAAAEKKAADAKQESASSGSAAGLGALGDRIVNTASTFKGTPYVWGATGPDSFDCSGYTQYVFKKMGISLPRTSQAQYDAAEHISKSQAQPGDLVFMGGPDSVYHVAIYAGNNKIWTAPEPGESVKLGNLFGDTSFGRMR